MKIGEEDLFLAEVIIKLGAIERLLIKTGVITSEDLLLEMKKISEEVMQVFALKTKSLVKD